MWEHVEFWHWWVLGIGLMLIEMFVPGTFFLGMGIAAGIVGLLLWLMPDLGWQYQLLCVSVLSVVSIVLIRRYLKSHPLQTDQPRLNRRGEQYLGRVFTLEVSIVNGTGKIRVDDSTWKVEGQDAPAGARVRVVDVEGTVLKVESVN